MTGDRRVSLFKLLTGEKYISSLTDYDGAGFINYGIILLFTPGLQTWQIGVSREATCSQEKSKEI